MAEVNCACHVNPTAPCDIPGGCGSAGCDHTSKPGGCVTCPVIRPDSNPRQPHQPPICDGDRRLLSRWLADIGALVTDLTNPEEPVVDQRRYERFGIRYLQHGGRDIVSLGEVWADPLATFGGVAPINSRSRQPTVTGSRERPIPIPVTALDLKAAARTPNPSAQVADWPEDQIGHLSAATVLDEWLRNIRARQFPDHHLPPATVTDMVTWLRNRLDTICDHYPDVADFADAIRHLRGALRSAAGDIEPPAEHCDGIPCRRCDLLTLYRKDGDVSCINPDCAAVLRDDEYQDWVKTLAAEQRVKRHAGANS